MWEPRDEGACGSDRQIRSHLYLVKAAIFGHDANWGRIPVCYGAIPVRSSIPRRWTLVFESAAWKASDY